MIKEKDKLIKEKDKKVKSCLTRLEIMEKRRNWHMDTLAEKENTIKVLQSCLNQMSKKKETKGEPKKVETKKKAEIIDVDQDDSNEVRFGCDMCDQTFEDKSDLMIHEDTVHTEEMKKK